MTLVKNFVLYFFSTLLMLSVDAGAQNEVIAFDLPPLSSMSKDFGQLLAKSSLRFIEVFATSPVKMHLSTCHERLEIRLAAASEGRFQVDEGDLPQIDRVLSDKGRCLGHPGSFIVVSTSDAPSKGLFVATFAPKKSAMFAPVDFNDNITFAVKDGLPHERRVKLASIRDTVSIQIQLDYGNVEISASFCNGTSTMPIASLSRPTKSTLWLKSPQLVALLDACADQPRQFAFSRPPPSLLIRLASSNASGTLTVDASPDGLPVDLTGKYASEILEVVQNMTKTFSVRFADPLRETALVYFSITRGEVTITAANCENATDESTGVNLGSFGLGDHVLQISRRQLLANASCAEETRNKDSVLLLLASTGGATMRVYRPAAALIWPVVVAISVVSLLAIAAGSLAIAWWFRRHSGELQLTANFQPQYAYHIPIRESVFRH